MRPPMDLLFTDLDGTLLEEEAYAFEPALGAVRELQKRGIPIIFCTSKTFPETLAIQAALGVADPFIVENGGAIYFRPGQLDPGNETVTARGAWLSIRLGTPRPIVLDRLESIRKGLKVEVRGFAQMDASEIADECGLPLEEARWAALREFDEPIRLVPGGPGDLAQLELLAGLHGLTVVRGGRFLHVAGGSDKGRAVRRVQALLSRSRMDLFTVGIGDSPNDILMLGAVTRPVVVRRPGGAHDPRVVEAVPGVQRAPGVGPAGWSAAVMDLIARGRGHGQ